jgi:arylsulfatase A-like enzyme
VNVANAITRSLAPGVRLWSEELKDAGYRMLFSGKWHVSDHEGPADRGWDTCFPGDGKGSGEKPESDYVERRWTQYRDSKVHPSDAAEREPSTIVRPGYPPYRHYGINEDPFSDAKVTNAAIDMLRDLGDSDQPWCQYVGTLGPHDPYCAPQRFVDMYDLDDIELPASFSDHMEDKPGFYRRTRQIFDQLTEEEHRESIRHYYALCSYEDYLFGELLKALDETGQADNTVVVFMSDHGDYLGDHGLWCKGVPAFKGAYHVPAIIRGPGIKNPGRLADSFVSLTDFGPTFLELAGIESETNLSGRSLVPFLNDEEQEDWRDALFMQTNGNELYGIQRSVVTREWKYVFNGFDFDEFYDLENDPDEVTNLINEPEHQETVKQLCTRMWQFGYEHQDSCINPYIMVGWSPVGPGVVFE